jgi:hypothetical protein
MMFAPVRESASGVAPAAMVERVKGIEPSYQAWEAGVLPLNYTRMDNEYIIRA